MNKKNLPNDLMKDILLFSRSRKSIIKEEILEKASKVDSIHWVSFNCNFDNEPDKKFKFNTKVIYNPIQLKFTSTENLYFMCRENIVNYISACGYRFVTFNELRAYLYIPQSMMIEQYLLKKKQRKK